VEEGVTFCPHCSAPQIRVIVAEPAARPAAAREESSSSSVGAESVPTLAIPMSWWQSVQPCAMAGAIAAITMVAKLVVPVIAVIGAGFLAVAFFRRRAPEAAMNSRAGARLGALCGLFSSGITAILLSLKITLLHQGGEVRRMILDWIQQAAARYPDPQAQPTLDFLRSSGGMIFMLVFFLIFAFLVFLILGTLGGALGGAILGRRDRS